MTIGDVGICEVVLEWGGAKGGRGGHPWSAGYAKLRRRQLTWWQERLALQTLGDLEDILGTVEKATLELQRAGDSGKTINDKTSSLSAFCTWCVKRELLDKHPLAALDSFNSAPKIQRRVATREELVRVLQAAPLDRQLLYETAFVSGLRRNELAQSHEAIVAIPENRALGAPPHPNSGCGYISGGTSEVPRPARQDGRRRHGPRGREGGWLHLASYANQNE